jgi:hypothetical protein
MNKAIIIIASKLKTGKQQLIVSRQCMLAPGNIKMKSDMGRRGFAFGSRMTFPFDMTILNVKLKWKI